MRLPEQLVLRDARVHLRDWQPSDAAALETVCRDPDVVRFTSLPRDFSREAAQAWIDRQAVKRRAGSALVLSISAQTRPAQPIGNVNLVRFSADGREAALGYWLTRTARGQGYATAAARLLCDWGFSSLALERIELAILPENLASHAVARRLGAEHHGLRHGSHEHDGQLWDTVIYTLHPRIQGDSEPWRGALPPRDPADLNRDPVRSEEANGSSGR